MREKTLSFRIIPHLSCVIDFVQGTTHWVCFVYICIFWCFHSVHVHTVNNVGLVFINL